MIPRKYSTGRVLPYARVARVQVRGSTVHYNVRQRLLGLIVVSGLTGVVISDFKVVSFCMRADEHEGCN